MDNPLLYFTQEVNTTTGEIRRTNKKGKEQTPSQTAYYNDLTFKIFDSGNIYIYGSLHKYFNKGLHNYNDFDINAIRGVLNDLHDKFDITTEQCILRNIELGINIKTPIEPNTILDNCFLHKTDLLVYQIHSDEGRYKQCEHSQYIVKIYNKTLHYQKKGLHPPTNLLRFELKFCKMKYFKELGIFTLNDLLEYGLHNFKSRILLAWNDILYFDNTVMIDEKKRNKFNNPNYWTGLIKNGQRSLFYKNKNELYKLIENNPNNIKQQLAEIMSKKIDELNIKSTQIDTLYIRSICTPTSDKICSVTGYDISMQKSNSKLLSHTGIKFYKKHNYKLYKQIERKYLSTIWINSDEQTKIREIAHNIRNSCSNQKIKQERLYIPTQSNLLNQFNLNTVKYG
ncbi:MAG: hypothetical protein KF732_11835 [Flavobacteriales bacterium]|nr:hypothetical protein [Flavobacteriales bacterium]